ncbi:hypothetical protein OIU74_023052 [Salix koriyanagi]|uniref:Uncharacterized protein n=1 Tax=Salix koriyanagi TaxID=2511006 RepID=A0A9Q0NQZ8_9ROSI|nr:hypothetical protein OIU74_023052 [Salix koriyanagi]
MNSLYLFLK